MAAASAWAPAPSPQYIDVKGCPTHSSIISPEVSDAPQHPLVILHIPPSRAYKRLLHRRRNIWYLVWDLTSGIAAIKHVATLNYPQESDPPSTTMQPDGCHRFWFNPNEEHDCKLEFLLQAEPPFIRLTGRSRIEKEQCFAPENPTVNIEVKEVEVLICEQGLCRKCAFCGCWEAIGDVRFSMVGMDKDNPLYWCGDSVSSFGSPKEFGTEAPPSRVVSKGSPGLRCDSLGPGKPNLLWRNTLGHGNPTVTATMVILASTKT